MAMKVLQCSFLSGIRLSKVTPLLEKLQPKYVLFPEDLRDAVQLPKAKPVSVVYYENETIRVRGQKQCTALEISTDVVSRFQWINLEEDINIARLKGELNIEHERHWLLSGEETMETCIDLGTLSAVLQEMGLNSTVEEAVTDSGSGCVLRIHEPSEALVEVRKTTTVVRTSDKHLFFRIFEALDRVLCAI